MSEIEQLQAKNAELAAEVERLTVAVTDRNWFADRLGIVIKERDDLRQQLAIAEEHAMRLREALENHSGNYKLSKAECAVINDLLDKPASREALDAYVAEKVKEIELSRDAIKAEWGKAYEIGALANHRLSTLLAVFHGDGGHHEDANGTGQSVEDALKVFYSLKQQRDLAVSAATKARNAAQQCASVCSKHLDMYPALLNMIDVVDGALSAINESEV